MKAKIELWSVQQLFDLRDVINEQPSYQRGGVWKDPKKSLLIDSLIRGIDMPKIFLHLCITGAYKYEVADGQQRINAILKFKSNLLPLRSDKILGLDLNVLDSIAIGGMYFNDLPKLIQNKFDKYLLTVAVIENATSEEVRTLFGRLQLGEALKPAEKRNAIISIVGNHINAIAIMHDFFVKSRIKSERFNRQDFLAHALTLISYDNDTDLKADLIQRMYLDESLRWPHKTIKKVTDVLDMMRKIDGFSKKRIINKFAFIDIFWFLYNEFENYNSIKYKGFAEHYDVFEERRLLNNKDPQKLNSSIKKSDKDLYRYILAFNFEGAKVSSINTRAEIIKREYNKYLEV